ncbi:MAG: hypothetical protein EXR90_06525 [Methyloglobulus sp.]|nr:hypothetical protein [Methyloglobulus sp.]
MAVALLLSLSVLMPRHVENDMHSSDFSTLSSDAQPEAMNANEVRVVFAENVDEQQKNTILEHVHGQFISGNPTAQGVYTVRLDRDMTKNIFLMLLSC